MPDGNGGPTMGEIGRTMQEIKRQVSNVRHSVANLDQRAVAMQTRLDEGIVPYLNRLQKQLDDDQEDRQQERQLREQDRKTVKYILLGQALTVVGAIAVALVVG